MVSGVQGLLDEQPAEPGAVHEEVASDLAAIGELQRLDVAVLAALLHFDDAAFGSLHAAGFRHLAQVPGV
jgi:hypothetical protein